MSLQSKAPSSGIEQKLKELKCFLSSLLYKCCEEIAHNLWLEDIERILYREPTWEELIEWKADKVFWKNNFQRSWKFVQNNLPCSTIFQTIDFFIKYELNLEPENQDYSKLKNLLINFVYDLYCDNSVEKTIDLMDDQNQVDEDFGKKIYLHTLASKLSSEIVEPLFNKDYPEVDGKAFFESFKSKCCFIPDIEGGRTIEKSSISVIGIHRTNYHFTVLETDEWFGSPEQNPRTAFLMHRKLQDPNSCAVEFRQEQSNGC